jgi:hypothetical protein
LGRGRGTGKGAPTTASWNAKAGRACQGRPVSRNPALAMTSARSGGAPELDAERRARA